MVAVKIDVNRWLIISTAGKILNLDASFKGNTGSYRDFEEKEPTLTRDLNSFRPLLVFFIVLYNFWIFFI
jgi:hypothetical protein